jgi:hypothetical protein
MSILNWFKDKKKQEQLLDLQIRREELFNDSIEKNLKREELRDNKDEVLKCIKSPTPQPYFPTGPYKRLKFVNNVLTIVFNDGSVINKSQATVNDFLDVKACSTEDEIIDIMRGKEEPKKDILDSIQVSNDDINSVIDFPDFETKGNSIYLKGIDRSLPPLLVSKFAEIINYFKGLGGAWENDVYADVEYTSLKRFFLWCCLNPRAEVADKLYDFLVRNDFKITKQGFFVALRNVVRKDEANHELVEIISNTYNNVKAVWKKSPRDFRIEEKDGKYSMHKVVNEPKGTIVGNLESLYLDLPKMKENSYTDAYTHSFNIRIGQKVTMSPEKCSWSTADCAEAGLHFAGHTAPYVLCGDTTVFTLHNPMKVVGIGIEKGRCWEYLPFMTSSVVEAEEIMNSADFDFLELDEQYAIDELQNLEEKVKEGFAAEATKHEFNFSNLSSSQMRNIVDVLNEMTDIIKNRVVNEEDEEE